MRVVTPLNERGGNNPRKTAAAKPLPSPKLLTPRTKRNRYGADLGRRACSTGPLKNGCSARARCSRGWCPGIAASRPSSWMTGGVGWPTGGRGSAIERRTCCRDGSHQLSALVFLDRPHVPVRVFEEAVA